MFPSLGYKPSKASKASKTSEQIRASTSPVPLRGPREKKGPFGLTTLHPLPGSVYSNHDLEAHIVFVHGLGGGSEDTWSKGKIIWIRDLLPHENGYGNFAIYSFGYDSDFKKSNFLDIADFSKSLLANMEDNSLIANSSGPLILVGHSMGGLVIKKAYIMAKQEQRFSPLGDRISVLCFIATPHQGSDHAAFLKQIIHLTFGFMSDFRPYLDDLNSGSEAIKAINESFLEYSKDLKLHSFFESQALNIPGVGRYLIVDKKNAVLGYPNERSELLNGDHRSICKFDFAQDTNYMRIHQALKRTIGSILERKTKTDQRNSDIRSGLNSIQVWRTLFDDTQENDLTRLMTERVPGTCEWLGGDPSYIQWLESTDTPILWVRGPPASGKSFLAAYAIEELRNWEERVCYHFFIKGDKSKASLSSFLLSMAGQMASFLPEVAELITQKLSQDSRVVKSGDHRMIWSKIWLYGILRLKLDPAMKIFWVIDSLDECQMDAELSKLLVRLSDCSFLRILITAKANHHIYSLAPKRIQALDIRMEDTQKDIAAYLDEQLPSESEVREGILAKSNGCFLWATLCVSRLKDIHGLQARLEALKREPPGIQQMYATIAQSLPNHQLSKTILTWVFCSVRPLSLSELHHVLPDLGDESNEDGVREMISQNCHNLVYIDKNNLVRTRHLSARDFLLRPDLNQENPALVIDRATGHKSLALSCLKYLISSEMNKKSRRKVGISRKKSAFAAYATDSLYLHLNESPAQDQDLLDHLVNFLQSVNLLTWIAYSARKGNLETVLRTAQALKDFLRRKSKTDLLLGREVVVVDEWSTDLIKLVSKFGRQLSSYPNSIYDLIPPFCPRETAPFKQFASETGDLTVCGLSETSWDDCLCTITPSDPSKENSSSATHSSTRRISESTQNETLKSIASSEKFFALGTSLGRILFFRDSTCLEEKVLNHCSSVKMLEFGTRKSVLACASNRAIQVWNTETWQSIWTAKIPKECMDMKFVDEDQVLLIALKNNSLWVINVNDGKLLSKEEWVNRLEQRFGHKFKARDPRTATFNAEMSVLAIVYRSQDIVVWNYEDDTYHLYNHDKGLSDGTIEPMASVNSLVFSHSPGSSLFVASYNLGDLVLFDMRLKVRRMMLSGAGVYYRLSASPDGRTFAGAANDGTIELYDFETLRMVYRIRSEDQGITTLAFNHDSARLYDIRGSGRSCRVWEPAALLRRDVETESIRTPSTYSRDSPENVIDRNDDKIPAVTALACHEKGNYFVGKHDATVWLFSSDTGESIMQLFAHHSSVTKMEYHERTRLLISVDTAGYLLIHTIHRIGGTWKASEMFSHYNAGTGVQQFVYNSRKNCILLCANDKSSILPIPGGQALGNSVDHDPEVDYTWLNHPTDPEILLLACHHTIQLYSWQELTPLTTDHGISLINGPGSDMQLRNVTPMLAGSILALNYSDHGPNIQPEVFTLPTSLLNTKIQQIDMTTNHQAVCNQIQYHIGRFRDREIFLGTNGWICAAGKHAFAGLEEVECHFMPPSDWLRVADQLLVRVTDRGDILFAWRGEVAVVKGGLDRVYDLKSAGDTG